MKLQEYLSKTETSQRKFAARVGITESAMSQYIKQGRIPAHEIIKKIHRETEGQVQPNDWYGL